MDELKQVSVSLYFCMFVSVCILRIILVCVWIDSDDNIHSETKTNLQFLMLEDKK